MLGNFFRELFKMVKLSHEWIRRRIGQFGVNPITSSPKGVAPSNFGC